MYLIDTHCHLDYLEDIPKIIETANEAGVKQIVTPSVNAASIDRIAPIVTTNKNVFWAVGIHPDEVIERKVFSQDIRVCEQALQKKDGKVVAIGECGLDFAQVKSKEEKERQIQLFKQHLRWAERFNLPLIIHNRKAGTEIMELTANNQYKGVLHCFSQGKKFLRQVLENTTLYFGIGGLVTLDLGLAEVVKNIPLERIVLETDAPYLTPNPVKATNPWPNVPANIVYIAQELTQIKNTTLAEVAKVTSKNAHTLFSLPDY